MTLRKLPIVYKSLEQVLSCLRNSEIGKTPEVHMLLKVSSSSNGVLDPDTHQPRMKPMSVIKPKMPIIVMEGLDGSGKSRVSNALVENLKLELHQTPPKRIKFLKDFFDDQNENLRRAYYSLGNYLAAQDIISSSFHKGIVIDRFWPSTAAYAMAHEMTKNKTKLDSELYKWPTDLLRPDLIIFLVVSEEVRRYRHAYRNTTNTPEEQLLANNQEFRENLIQSYKKIEGPKVQVFDANEDIKIVQDRVCEMVLAEFPILSGSPDSSDPQQNSAMTA